MALSAIGAEECQLEISVHAKEPQMVGIIPSPPLRCLS